ncbi:MAG: cyclic-di-AMP receptor [Lachnospiraceae bacterium]|nr:cyclic-di-AMP receptor [Lachnospiraceae bacterium]
MKLIYAIINNNDADNVMLSLSKKGFSATKLSSTGGFLRKGNTTLMVGAEDDDVQRICSLIEKVCGEREYVEVDVPCINSMNPGYNSPMYYGNNRQKVEVGGAIIFVTNVEYFKKI